MINKGRSYLKYGNVLFFSKRQILVFNVIDKYLIKVRIGFMLDECFCWEVEAGRQAGMEHIPSVNEP